MMNGLVQQLSQILIKIIWKERPEAFKADALNYYGIKQEPEDIHQKMYEIATKSATTIQLDPPGGSENYHEGPGGWNSGTGIQQFR